MWQSIGVRIDLRRGICTGSTKRHPKGEPLLGIMGRQRGIENKTFPFTSKFGCILNASLPVFLTFPL